MENKESFGNFIIPRQSKRYSFKLHSNDFKHFFVFFQRKQSDQMNALIAIGIGVIFGVFSIEQTRWYSVIPFSVLILISFAFFYKRYFFYYLSERIALFQARLITPSDYKTLRKLMIPRGSRFWEDQDWFTYLNEQAQSENIARKIILSLAPISKWELFCQFTVWGVLLLSWLFIIEPIPKDQIPIPSQGVIGGLTISFLIFFIASTFFHVSFCERKIIPLCRKWEDKEKVWFKNTVKNLISQPSLANYLINQWQDEVEKKNNHSLFFEDCNLARTEMHNLRQALINNNIVNFDGDNFILSAKWNCLDKSQNNLQNNLYDDFFNSYRIIRRVRRFEYWQAKNFQGMKCLNEGLKQSKYEPLTTVLRREIHDLEIIKTK